MALFAGPWPAIAAALTLSYLFPRHRILILGLAGALVAVGNPLLLLDPMPPSHPGLLHVLWRIAAREGVLHPSATNLRLAVAAALAGMGGLAFLAGRRQGSLGARRPVTAALAVIGGLVLVLALAPLHGWPVVLGWIVVLVAARTVWYFCYAVIDRRDACAAPARAVFLWPVWMICVNSSVPFGKGTAYLRKIEARDPAAFTDAQVSGLRLLLWALVLNVGQGLFALAVLKAGIPGLDVAIARSAAGQPFAWHWNVVSLVTQFLSDLLGLSVFGHFLIACVRMAGFRALRNTYRPFRSRNLAEFWNRYYYYFKELMADLFFYPTYLRCFKKHPRVRMVVATLMAACVGNCVYHFLRDIGFVAEEGLWTAMVRFQTYAFYTLVLGVGISLSQLRAMRRRPAPTSWWLRTALPAAWIFAFYCLSHVFGDYNRNYGLKEHLVFFGHLFGL
jgi:hypothetical protein